MKTDVNKKNKVSILWEVNKTSCSNCSYAANSTSEGILYSVTVQLCHQPVLSGLKLNKVRLSTGMGVTRKTLLQQKETPGESGDSTMPPASPQDSGVVFPSHTSVPVLWFRTKTLIS